MAKIKIEKADIHFLVPAWIKEELEKILAPKNVNMTKFLEEKMLKEIEKNSRKKAK